MNKHNHTQAGQPAPQAVSRPIDNSRFFTGCLLDGFTRSKTLQNCFLDAPRGIPCLLLPLDTPVIHNCQLSILLPEQIASRLCSEHTSSAANSLLRAYLSTLLIRSTYVLETAPIPCCSGTPDRAEARLLPVCPKEWRETPVGFSLDRARYTPTKKAREATNQRAQYTLSLAFGSLRATCPVKADSRNVPGRSHACQFPFGLCTPLRRSAPSGAEQVTRTALVAWYESEACYE